MSALMRPEALLANLPIVSGSYAWFIFCGTLPTITSITVGERYDLEMFDPVLRRSISHTYEVHEMSQSL